MLHYAFECRTLTMDDALVNERYSKAKLCVDRLIESMNRNGITRQLQMYRAFATFDFSPLCNLFDGILVSSREQYILNLLKEVDHLTFDLGKLRDRSAREQQRANSTHAQMARDLQPSSWQRLGERFQKRKDRILGRAAAWESAVAEMKQQVSIARHLDRTLHVLLRNFRVELRDVRSEIDVQCSAIPIVLSRFRNKVIHLADRFGRRLADQYHSRIQGRIQRVTSANSRISSSLVGLQGAMSALLVHLMNGDQASVTDAVDFEQVIRSAIDGARRNAVFSEKDILAAAPDSDVSDQVLTAIETDIARLDGLYGLLLQRAQRRRVRLETELDSLLGRIKKLEARQVRRSVAVARDASEPQDEFDRVTRAIDDSLLELSHQLRAHKDQPSPAEFVDASDV
jgi:predicted  nucleic acid-binding Zn-ribbon protein